MGKRKGPRGAKKMTNPILDLARKLVREGKFANEDDALVHIVTVFGAAMEGKLRPTTAEAEVAVLDARDSLLDAFPEFMPPKLRRQ